MDLISKPASAVQARSLSKILRGQVVLREIDLDITRGECVALKGDNGSGKTTLLRCLAAIARPTAGEVCWFGRPAGAHAVQRRLVGMMTHQSRLYPHLTLRENLLFGARMCGMTEATQRADAILEQAGLSRFANREARHVSKGMSQRLALARAFIHEPPILLLDEPFCSLDAAGRGWLTSLLRERRHAGCAICISSHEEEQHQPLADRTLSLHATTLTALHVSERLETRMPQAT